MKDKAVLKNKNAVLFILEGLAMATAINMSGPFIQKFTERLGGNSWHIALINSLPPLVAIIFLIPCGILINKIGHKKQTTTFLIFFNALFFLAMAFVPGLPNNMKATVFVIIFGLMNWPQVLYITTWQSFYSDTIRGKVGNSIYSIRSRYVSFVGIFVVLVSGFFITKFSSNESMIERTYSILFILCFIFMIIQGILLSKVQERHTQRVVSNHDTFNVAIIKVIFKDKKFMIFCFVTFIFYASWQMGWPIFYTYNSSKEFVGFNELWFGILNVCTNLAAFFAYPFWNKIITKRGTGFVMILGAISLMINPFMYLISTNAYIILAVNVLVGFGVTAYTLALFCRTLEIVPDDGKIVYIAIYNTLINVSGFISPLIGTWIQIKTGVIHTMFIIGFSRIVAVAIIITSIYFGDINDNIRKIKYRLAKKKVLKKRRENA